MGFLGTFGSIFYLKNQVSTLFNRYLVILAHSKCYFFKNWGKKSSRKFKRRYFLREESAYSYSWAVGILESEPVKVKDNKLNFSFLIPVSLIFYFPILIFLSLFLFLDLVKKEQCDVTCDICNSHTLVTYVTVTVIMSDDISEEWDDNSYLHNS